MGSSFMGNHNYERIEPILVSPSSEPLIGLRSIKLGASVDKQEEGKCCRFSIRGYVSKMRKSDKKTCWPFHNLDNLNKLEEHANLLPPISVTEFRWWDCKSCLHKTNTSEAAIENGATMNRLNQEVRTKKTTFHKNSIVASLANEPNLLSGFQVVHRDNILEGRRVEADSSVNAIDGQHHPSLCCDEKRKESVTEERIREGIPRYKGSVDGSEDQYQIANSLTSGASKVEKGLTGDRNMTETGKVLFGLEANKSGCSLSDHGTPYTLETVLNEENASDTVTLRLKGAGLICGLADAEMDTETRTTMTGSASGFCHKDDQGPRNSKLPMRKEPHDNEVRDCGTPNRVDNCIQKDDDLTADTVHTCELDSLGLLGSNHKISKVNEDLFKNKDEDQHFVSHQGTSNGNLHRKKAQKVRLLNDILKSEVLGMSEKLHVFNENEEVCQTRDYSEKPNVSEGEKILPDPKIHVTIEEKKRKPIKRKKRNKLPDVEDEGPSLIQWLKRMPKKVKTHKGDGEPKCYDSVVCSRLTSDIATGKGLHSRIKGCGVIQGYTRKIVVDKKQNKVSEDETGEPCFMPRSEGMTGESCAIVEDAVVKQLSARIIHPKSAGNVINEGTLQSNLKIQDSPRKTVVTSKKQIPQPEDGGSSPMHRPKDSFGTFKYGTISGFESRQKVSKKRSTRRTNQVGEQVVVDGIPIEILELLQKNWHQRNIVNAERSTGNMDNLSEMAKNVKEDAPSALRKNQAVQYSLCNHTGGDVCTAVKSKGDAIRELNAHPSHGNVQREIYMNMNQVEQFYAPTGFAELTQFREQPTNGGQLPVTGSVRNCCPQNHSWNSIMMQNSESHHEARTISGQNPCRPTLHGGSSMLYSRPFGMNNSENIHPDFCQMNMLSQYTLPPSHSNKSTHTTDGPKCNNPTVTQPHKKKRKVDSMPNKITPLAGKFPYLEAGNEMRPLDLYTNDTISAMHLLRLMDPAVCSSTPLRASLDKKQRGLYKQSDLSHTHNKDLLGFEAGFRTTEPPKHPLMLEHLDQNQHPENSTKVFCPVPKIGVPESLFQKDMTTDLNNIRTPFAFEDGKFTEVASFSLKGYEKENTKNSHLFTQTRVSAQSSASVDGNSHGQLLPALASITHSQFPQETELIHLGIKNKDKVAWPLKTCSQTENCVVNRNPADFAIPGEDNVYMITYENLKTGDVSSPGNRQCPTYTDGQRRQRVMKLTALKGLLRS